MTESERLFEHYCQANGIRWKRIPASTVRTPDYAIQLGGVEVVCEIKQIDSSDHEKHASTQDEEAAFIVQSHLRRKLKSVSGQLKNASSRGAPALLVVYDNTPFRSELDHEDVVEALYGKISQPLAVSSDGERHLGAPFFGGNRGLTPTQNTALSAVAVLEERRSGYWLRVYHNLHAQVALEPDLLSGIAAEQRVLPGDTHVVT